MVISRRLLLGRVSFGKLSDVFVENSIISSDYGRTERVETIIFLLVYLCLYCKLVSPADICFSRCFL
jgi:hypothetical protein